mmetsp:Transcript_6205/g.10074  ORF Transcript_6205/g.10074 Transcript_6205/m.10074 type:complete len:86 (+) Transcript_6205:2972-3229(+)
MGGINAPHKPIPKQPSSRIKKNQKSQDPNSSRVSPKIPASQQPSQQQALMNNTFTTFSSNVIKGTEKSNTTTPDLKLAANPVKFS